MDCEGCRQSLRCFEILCGDQERLLEFLRCHGVILKEKSCDKCHRPCFTDLNRMSFRCNRYLPQNIADRKRKRYRRCEFKVTISAMESVTDNNILLLTSDKPHIAYNRHIKLR